MLRLCDHRIVYEYGDETWFVVDSRRKYLSSLSTFHYNGAYLSLYVAAVQMFAGFTA